MRRRCRAVSAVGRAVRKQLSMPDASPAQMFKRLLPPDLFATFIDTGHYNAQLNAYAPLVLAFEGAAGRGGAGEEEREAAACGMALLVPVYRNPTACAQRSVAARMDAPPELSEKQRSGVSAALDDVSVDRSEGSGLRSVGGYVILEMLGKGAFGCGCGPADWCTCAVGRALSLPLPRVPFPLRVPTSGLSTKRGSEPHREHRARTCTCTPQEDVPATSVLVSSTPSTGLAARAWWP
jgi:hypothetical protein